MVKNLFKDYICPIAVFSGGMIGVGFLSLPYVAMKSGIWVTFIYFAVITALVALINLIFCQLSLKTPDFKRFPGFAKFYLGKWGEFFAFFSVILGTIGVLLAYLVIGGEFITTALQPVFAGNISIYTFIFFIIVSAIVYFDIKIVSKVEFWVIVLLFLSLFLVFAGSLSQIKFGNIFAGSSWLQNLFLPYGPLLFALWGTGLIPEVEEMLGKGKKRLKKIVIISTLVISVFYFLFVLLVLGITGSQTEQTALAGLTKVLGDHLASLPLFAGILAVFTAFVVQGMIFKKTLVLDLKIKHWQAFVMTCFTPMILFLAGFKSFISILSLTGGVLLGINGVLILLMYKKIGGKNIIIYPLSLVFLLGIIYELVYFVK